VPHERGHGRAPRSHRRVIGPDRAECRFHSTAFRQHRAPVFVDDDVVSSSDREAGPLVADTEHDPVDGDALRAVSPGTPESERDTEVRIEIGRTLGRGGMAEVRLGTQPRLDRAVAVKTLRPERRSAKHEDRLVREARIAARLEHPNIVPVHDLLPTDDGPHVVLRLVEGDTWGALMNDEARLRVAFGVDDLLEWNLGVLMTSLPRALVRSQPWRPAPRREADQRDDRSLRRGLPGGLGCGLRAQGPARSGVRGGGRHASVHVARTSRSEPSALRNVDGHVSARLDTPPDPHGSTATRRQVSRAARSRVESGRRGAASDEHPGGAPPHPREGARARSGSSHAPPRSLPTQHRQLSATSRRAAARGARRPRPA
jgi:hypothetical protein